MWFCMQKYEFYAYFLIRAQHIKMIMLWIFHDLKHGHITLYLFQKQYNAPEIDISYFGRVSLSHKECIDPILHAKSAYLR